VSYIPWGRLSALTDWAALEEGGSLDEDTMPPWMGGQLLLHQQQQHPQGQQLNSALGGPMVRSLHRGNCFLYFGGKTYFLSFWADFSYTTYTGGGNYFFWRGKYLFEF